jgi:3-hydroxyacyl-[acyl-carrier-protein] dehydratase
LTSLATETRQCVISPRKEVEPGIWLSTFRFPHDFPGFAGHFPNAPVLPGIVQILAVIHTAGEYTLHRVKNCKFLRPVHPEEELSVRLRLTLGQNPEQGDVIAQGELSANSEACASMALCLRSN